MPKSVVKYWIGVVSRQHVLRGVSGGFAQVCHGKVAPLKSMNERDWLVYYSPQEEMGGNIPCQRFTAIGRIKLGAPYPFDMGHGFVPYRRDVDFISAKEVDIRPLIHSLSFIRNKQSWGYPFRRGCFSVTHSDFSIIASAMGVDIGPSIPSGQGEQLGFAGIDPLSSSGDARHEFSN